MKPIIEQYNPGTIYEVNYIDGIMVAPDVRLESGHWLNTFKKYGNQKKPEFWFKRKPKLVEIHHYYVKDVIILSISFHLMVSTNEDFSDWFLLKKPLRMTMTRQGQ